jgi:hypothetical protein
MCEKILSTISRENSSSLLSVGGGADDLGVESTDPEKTLEEHDFNNFLNCPLFHGKKSTEGYFRNPH